MGTQDDRRSAELTELARWLGEPSRDLILLGEGNASVDCGGGAFLVTASGAELGVLAPGDLVRVDLAETLALVDRNPAGDELRDGLAGCMRGPTGDRRPSVETPLHAVCLSLPGVRFVGHTHPTAINAITCSNRFDVLGAGPVFHDEVVVCGAEPLLLPYADSGPPLARVARDALADYAARRGEPPRAVYLQNHGFVALGRTRQEVQAITAVAVKAARIRLGAAAMGGVHPLDAEAVARLDSRPDERYRRLRIAALGDAETK